MTKERDGGELSPIGARIAGLTTQILGATNRSSIDGETYKAYCYCRCPLCQDEMLPERSRDSMVFCDAGHKSFCGNVFHGWARNAPQYDSVRMTENSAPRIRLSRSKQPKADAVQVFRLAVVNP
jgi:hypothetical protein